MDGLSKVCVGYALGSVQVHRNLTVVPIQAKKGGKKSNLDYIVLSEGIEKGSVQIAETGNVNQLWLSNNSDKGAFVMKGEYVVGGKQNRMITVNGLIAPYTGRMHIPVHCVQHGRWDAPKGFGLADAVVSASLRAGVMKSSSGGSGQGVTWGRVDSFMAMADVDSPTQDYHEVQSRKEGDVKEYITAFRKEKGQIGAVVAVQYANGQQQLFVDMFDLPKTLDRHYERLLASYALEAAVQRAPAGAKMSKDNAANFLSHVLGLPTTESQSISLGTDHEIYRDGVQGSALVYEGTMVYLGAKNNAGGERRMPQSRPDDMPISVRRGAL